MNPPSSNQLPQAKLTIILKPGVLAQPSKTGAKRNKKRDEKPVPAELTLVNPTPNENKFTGKLRNVLDALTFAVKDYIIHNLDNEATSQAYKSQLQTGLGRIRDDFISTRAADNTGSQITPLSNK
jgi:hypothetical protein